MEEEVSVSVWILSQNFNPDKRGSKRESKIIFRGGVDKYLCTGLDTAIMEPFEKGINCIILHHSRYMKDS